MADQAVPSNQPPRNQADTRLSDPTPEGATVHHRQRHPLD